VWGAARQDKRKTDSIFLFWFFFFLSCCHVFLPFLLSLDTISSFNRIAIAAQAIPGLLYIVHSFLRAVMSDELRIDGLRVAP